MGSHTLTCGHVTCMCMHTLQCIPYASLNGTIDPDHHYFLALPPREVGSRVSRKSSIRQAVWHSEYRGMNPLNTRCNIYNLLLLHTVALGIHDATDASR
jgi:hypothetical protein